MSFLNIIHQIAFYISSFFLAIMPLTKYSEGVVGQPRSFLPSHAVTQADKTISSLIYRGLFKYDIYGTLVPDLAETWAISEDGLVYTIKLKDNQYWTNGKKITSDDLIYTAFQIEDLQGVATDRVDDLTVRYTLPNKFSPFLSLMTVGVMESNSDNENNPLNPVSSGKFRVLRVERSGPIVKEVVLLNNDKSDNIRKLVFRYYINEDELVTAARLGEIDGFMAQGNYNLQNFTLSKFPLQGVYYSLYFNLKNETLQDIELRKKMEKSLSLAGMIFEYGIVVQGPISRSSYTDAEVQFDKYDKTYAGEMLNKTIKVTVPDIEEHLDLAEDIEDVWEDKLGLAVELEIVDPEVFVDQVIKPRNYEVLFYGQEVGRDPDRYVNWHSTQKEFPGLNLSGFDHVRADRALEEGRKEVDNEKRVTHYNEFQKVISEQVPAIFLYHPFVKYYVSKNIEGIGEKYTFTQTDRFLDFTNWKRVKVF